MMRKSIATYKPGEIISRCVFGWAKARSGDSDSPYGDERSNSDSLLSILVMDTATEEPTQRRQKQQLMKVCRKVRAEEKGGHHAKT